MLLLFMSESVWPMFSSRSLIVAGLMSRSLIHLDIICLLLEQVIGSLVFGYCLDAEIKSVNLVYTIFYQNNNFCNSPKYLSFFQVSFLLHLYFLFVKLKNSKISLHYAFLFFILIQI